MASRCFRAAAFEGSEDATLYRAGLAFVSSGLVPSPTQRGLILLADLTATKPTITPLVLHNLNASYGFRPHGLHFDNSSSRLYAVSHSDTLKEESIYVFDVNLEQAASVALPKPTLSFRYLLTSPRFEYHTRALLWFLNDVAVVDGKNELYVTQLGPIGGGKFGKDKALWRCTWREADKRADGRLPASCAHAYKTLSLGLNGIAIEPAPSERLWVNDEFGAPGGGSQLWPFVRNLTDGGLTPQPSIPLGGSSIDNAERDYDSGDLQMGQYQRADGGGKKAGAELLARAVDPASGTYGPAKVAVALPQNVTYQVSTALTYGKWTLLGSPWDVGPYLCEAV